MSEQIMLVVVSPVHPDDAEEFSDDATEICETHEEYVRKYARFEMIVQSLETFGFKPATGRNSTINMEWCNGEGAAPGQLISGDDTAILNLAGRAEEWVKLRETALAKLTDEEKAALNIFDDAGICESCYRTKRRREW